MEKNPKGILKEEEKNIKSLISRADRRIKKNPLPFLGTVAVVSLLVGFLMGKGSKT